MLRIKITINTVAIFTTVKGKCQEFNSIYCNSASKHHNLSYRHSKKIESGRHFDSQDPSVAMTGSTETPGPRTVPCPSTPRPSRWRSRPAARPGPVCRPGASGWCRAPPGPQTSGACSSWGGGEVVLRGSPTLGGRGIGDAGGSWRAKGQVESTRAYKTLRGPEARRDGIKEGEERRRGCYPLYPSDLQLHSTLHAHAHPGRWPALTPSCQGCPRKGASGHGHSPGEQA